MIPLGSHPGRDEAASIDLLVDGALPEADRRALLTGLDDSPGGWRRCALALLEAQAWREAFSDADKAALPPCPPSILEPRPAFRAGPWLAVAAASLVAFGAGWMARPPGISPSPAPSIAAAPPRRLAPPILPKAPIPPAPIVARIDPARPSPPNYARGRLEREGFRFEQSRMFVPAKTSDGRAVAVPVQRTTVRYVGNRSV